MYNKGMFTYIANHVYHWLKKSRDGTLRLFLHLDQHCGASFAKHQKVQLRCAYKQNQTKCKLFKIFAEYQMASVI